MKIEITADAKNPLYDRREITATASEMKATPSRKDVAAEISKAAGVKADCIVIDKIEHRFGRPTAAVKAKIYASAEAAKRFDKAYRIARTEKKPAAKEGEAAPAKAEEKK